MVPVAIAGNIFDEAPPPLGNIFNEAMRGLAEREKEADSSIAGRGAIVFRDNVRWLANLFPHATQAGAADAYLRFQITKANQIPKQPGKFLERLPGGVLQLRTTLEHRSKARA